MKSLIVTDSGNELIARVIAGETTISFTRIAVSDCDYSEIDVKQIKDLQQIKQTVPISKISRLDKNMIEVLAAVENRQVEEPYFVYALGIYAKDSNKNEILYGVSLCDENPDYMPAYERKVLSGISYRLDIAVGDSEQVLLDVNPAAVATTLQVEQIENDLIRHTQDMEIHVTEEKQKKWDAVEDKVDKLEAAEIKMLGWSVPRECVIQNEINGNKFIQKVGRIDLGELEWRHENEYNVFHSNSIKRNMAAKVQADGNEAVKGFCRNYTVIGLAPLGNSSDMSVAIGLNGIEIYISNHNYSDAATFKTAMQGQYLYYELANYITKTIDGNEIGEAVSNMRKETTVNLLKPTLKTTERAGITCTNNGDGTYTISGTNTSGIFSFGIADIKIKKSKVYKMVGCPKGQTSDTSNMFIINDDRSVAGNDFGDGCLIYLPVGTYNIYIEIRANETVNLTYKPMLTTNLTATLDDFVPYTGDTGQLNSDVAEIRKEYAKKTEVPSLVKVDNATVFLSEDGTLSSKGVLSDDDRKKLDSIENGANKTVLQNNLVTNVEGYALDARQGKVLDDKITKLKNESITHNIPRTTPKDITSYITDGTFYKRLNGTDGYSLFEDIFAGDYIKMSRAITCPNQDSSLRITGSQYVTIAGLDTLMNNGDSNSYINYHHAIMVAGQGFGGIQHFGRHRMNATNTSEGGYTGSEMNKSIIGDATTSGDTGSGATINQQLYAEFGSHLKTTRELVSNSINSTGLNRFGSNTGCSNNWNWINAQAILMSEIEVYGSTVWSSSGYDTGNAKMQMPLFAHSRTAMNDRTSWYWLKDVASGTYYCYCNDCGHADYGNANDDWFYVRPRFVIGA